MKMVELTVYLHGINNGMAIVTARNNDLNKKYLALNKVEFTCSTTTPRQTIMRIPEYLAIGEELIAPPSKADDDMTQALTKILSQPDPNVTLRPDGLASQRVTSEGPGVGGIPKEQVKPFRLNPVTDRALSRLERELPDENQGDGGQR